MGGTGVIDQFLETFTRYIDSGFGLLGSEVGYVATTLAAIDITLAALFPQPPMFVHVLAFCASRALASCSIITSAHSTASRKRSVSTPLTTFLRRVQHVQTIGRSLRPH